MRIVGLSDDVAMPTAKAIDEACFPGTQLALYDHVVRVILVGDRWRDVGGLTRLIHEMKHYADDIAGRPHDDECSAARLAADWADAHGFTNEARRERRYGVAFCKEGAVVATTMQGERTDASGNSDGSLATPVLFLSPDP